MMASEIGSGMSGAAHKDNERDTGPLDPSKMTIDQRKMLEKINALERRLDALQAEVHSYIRVTTGHD